jgi:glycerol uptake facilitator-like aquaporin
LSQTLIKLSCRLTPNQKKFIAEVIGTFIVVVFATGSVVLDSRVLGISFIAFAPFVGIAIAVYMFGKISMAHFNPAVTIGFLITKHITKTTDVLLMCRNNWCSVRESICKIRNWI